MSKSSAIIVGIIYILFMALSMRQVYDNVKKLIKNWKKK